MTTPRKTRIEAAMVARFQGITVAGGYNTTIANVYNNPSLGKTFEDVPSDQRPCINLVSKATRREPFPGHYRVSQRYDLYGFITAADRGAANTALDNLEYDIRKAVNTDPTWGASVDYSGERNAMLTDFEELHAEDIPDPTQGALIVPITVVYLEGRND